MARFAQREWVVLDVQRAMLHGVGRGWPEHVAERERRQRERDRPGLKFVLRETDGERCVAPGRAAPAEQLAA